MKSNLRGYIIGYVLLFFVVPIACLISDIIDLIEWSFNKIYDLFFR